MDAREQWDALVARFILDRELTGEQVVRLQARPGYQAAKRQKVKYQTTDSRIEWLLTKEYRDMTGLNR